MKCLIFLCLISLFFTLLHASIVEETCKNVTASNEGYNFCITSFQASPRSRKADKYELAVIGLELSLANHTYNIARAKELGQQPGFPSVTKQCCFECAGLYRSSLMFLNTAINNAKNKWPFGMDITSARTYVETCQQGFEAGQKDLLETENRNAFALDCMIGGINTLIHPQQ